MKTPQSTIHSPQCLNAKFLLLLSIFVMIRIAIFAQNCSTAIPIYFDYDPYNNQVPIQLENFGYNTYQLYDKAVQSESAINDTFDYYKNCSDQYNPRPDFMAIWDNLPGNMMRFPGGTASQLYHSGFTNYPYTVTPAQPAPNYYPDITSCPYASYTSGTSSTFRNQNNNKFKGYGVKNKNNVGGERLPNTADFGSGTSSIWRKLYEDLDPPQKRNIIYDFIELIKAKEVQQGKPIEVLYVFNIVTHLYNHTTANLIENVIENKIFTTTAHTQLRPEFVSEMNENLNTLRFLLNNGINVAGVEMGNELTHARYKEMNLSPNEYIEIVKQYAIQLRTLSEFSGIKIGVVGEVSLEDPLRNLSNYSCSGNGSQDEPQGLLSTNYNLCWDFKLANNNSFTKNNITYPLYDAFIIHKYFGTYQNIYNASVDTSLANFMDGIDKLKTIYLSNNQNYLNDFKIWFTEWNQDAKVIDTIKKSENTRCIFDVYSFITQYNAMSYANFGNKIFEYTIFHNFMGDSPISLLNTNANGTSIVQRDNIKSHYLFSKIQDSISTTSKNKINSLIPKSNELNILDINVNGNRFWLKDYTLLAYNTIEDGITVLKYWSGCGIHCWEDTLYKIIYFPFNNSTNNSYCINPTFKNLDTLYTILPSSILGNNVSHTVLYYKEEASNATDKGFESNSYTNNGNIIPPKSIGYIKYSYFFKTDGCYNGARLFNQKEEKTNKINNALSIYPNPAQNLLYLNGLELSGKLNAIIYDVQGKATNYKLTNNEIDISDLSNGIYFLSLENEGILFHQKFVIQK